MSDPNDNLVERIKAHDEEALVAFVESHRPQLLAFLEKNISATLRRKVEPADLLQETVLSALPALKDLELGDRDPFSWLCQLAERRIIDAHRKLVAAQKRTADREVGIFTPTGDGENQGLVGLLVSSMTSPSKAFSRDQREFHLLEALDSLPDEAKRALRMRYVENLPSKEIAARLGKTDGATRVLLTRSLARLQEILGGNSLFQSFQQGR